LDPTNIFVDEGGVNPTNKCAPRRGAGGLRPRPYK